MDRARHNPPLRDASLQQAKRKMGKSFALRRDGFKNDTIGHRQVVDVELNAKDTLVIRDILGNTDDAHRLRFNRMHAQSVVSLEPELQIEQELLRVFFRADDEIRGLGHQVPATRCDTKAEVEKQKIDGNA